MIFSARLSMRNYLQSEEQLSLLDKSTSFSVHEVSHFSVVIV